MNLTKDFKIHKIQTNKSERKILKSIIMLRNCNTILSVIQKKINQDIFKYINKFKSTISHPALIEMYKIIHKKIEHYTLFSRALETLKNILSHILNLNKCSKK